MPTLSGVENTTYKSFEEVYNCDIPVEPSDKDRPGLQDSDDLVRYDLPKPPWKITTTKSRQAIFCTEYRKPRMLYSASYLNAEQHERLEIALEQFEYICGGPFISLEHDLSSVVFIQNIKNGCKDHIRPMYFKAGEKLDGFKMICHSCLEECVPAVEDESFISQYSFFAPRYESCKLQEKEYFTKKQQGKKGSMMEYKNLRIKRKGRT